MPELTGWGGPQQYTWDATEPPQYVLDQIGDYDRTRYYWNPDTFSLVDRTTGGSYQYDRSNPANGTDVVTNLSDYNRTGQAQLHYGAGETPYFGFGDSAQGYNAGDAPNSGTFISANPQAISDYQSHRNDVVGRGALTVAAVPALAATGAALGWGAGGFGATPTVNSLPLTGGGVAAGSTAAGGAGATAGAGGASMAASPWLTGLNIGASVLGGVLADRAADAGVDASREAITESGRQFDLTRGDLLPTIQLGQQSAGQLQRYLGGDRSVFQESAGRDYLLSEGQKAIERYLSSRGMSRSGAAGTELTRHAIGIADQEEGDFVNRLLASAGLGTTGASTSANAGANHAANVSSSLQSGANARASGYAGVNNAVQGGIQNQLLMRYLGRAA